MRGAVACVMLMSASLAAISPAAAQRGPTTGSAPPPLAAVPTVAPSQPGFGAIRLIGRTSQV